MTQESVPPAERPDAATFETALAELQRVVHDLEEGQLGLEASLARFEAGIGLLRNCYTILENAEQKIEILTGADSLGKPLTAPFDATATIDHSDKSAKKPGRRRTAPKNEPRAPELPPSAESDPEEDRLF